MTKKRYTLWIIFAIAVFSFVSFVFPGGDEMPQPEGKAVWEYISQENPYKDWKQWPGKDGMYEGKSPHGAYLQLFVNDKAYDAIKKDEKMPAGAMIVKENYADDKKTLNAITPMYKSDGYNPDAGDWFWAKYSENGEEMAAGKVEGCIDCHAKAKDTEYLFNRK